MKTFAFIILLSLWFTSHGQSDLTEITAQGLIVGDQIPKGKQLDVINDGTARVSLEEFEGKLVILDFWATWCTPCLASFSKLDSLQGVFGEEIQIIPVTYEDQEKVNYSLSKVYPNYSKSSMPFVYADNYLRKLFPHQVLPHYVWISPKGTVLSVTSGDEVNSATIKMVLNYLKSKAL